MREHYEIEYARFFNYPKSPSTTSTLALVRSLPKSKKQRNGGGTWLSASTAASLHLFPDLSTSPSFPQFVLVVSLHDRIHEEHYISKLHFSWPQVSCVSQCPAKGSRVIFASYKDCVGQIQKFAMRFQDSSESLTFVNSLKVCAVSGYQATTSDQKIYLVTTLLLLLSCIMETTVPHEGGVISTLLPTSFTAFLVDGCTEAQQEPLAVPENVDLTSYIVKYMPGSSFNDMLNKLEKVISDMGGDLSLQL